jgi:hypothetical protein
VAGRLRRMACRDQAQRMQVESILINQTEIGEALRQFRPADFDLPGQLAFNPPIAASRSSTTSVALGPTAFNERDTTHFGLLRHAAAKSRSSATPIRLIFVSVAHHLVHAATVHDAAQATHVVNEVTEKHETWRTSHARRSRPKTGSIQILAWPRSFPSFPRLA